MAIIGRNHNGEPMFDNAKEYYEYLKEKERKEYLNRSKFQVVDDIGQILVEMQECISMNVFRGMYENEQSDFLKLNDRLQIEIEIFKTK